MPLLLPPLLLVVHKNLEVALLLAVESTTLEVASLPPGTPTQTSLSKSLQPLKVKGRVRH